MADPGAARVTWNGRDGLWEATVIGPAGPRLRRYERREMPPRTGARASAQGC